MGAASGESMGGRGASGELQQTESVDVESANGRVKSDEDVGDQIRRGSSSAPQSGYSYRNKQSHIIVLPSRARCPLQSSDPLSTALHLHLLRHRPGRLQPVQRITHLRQ